MSDSDQGTAKRDIYIGLSGLVGVVGSNILTLTSDHVRLRRKRERNISNRLYTYASCLDAVIVENTNLPLQTILSAFPNS